jgi:hypothetical protein
VSNLRSVPLDNGRPVGKSAPDINGYKIAGVVVWWLGVAATHQLLTALGVAPQGGVFSPALWAGIAIAIATQALLTVLERPVLLGRPNSVSLAVLGVDTLINAGGVFPFALRLGATPTGEALAAAAGQPALVSPGVALLVSLVAGFILAATPEAAWRWRE